GAQEVVRALARYLPAEGCPTLVATFRDGPLRAAIERSGVEVVVLEPRRRSILAGPASVAELLRIRRALAGLARRHRAAVVQTHLLVSLDFVVLTLRSEPGVRAVLWTVHNARLELRPDQLPGHHWLLGPKRLAYRLLYGLGGRLGAVFVAVSDDVGRAVRRTIRPPRRSVVVIPNGVDVERYGNPVDRAAVRRGLGLPGDARLAVVVAKLLEQKGHAVLLAALPSVVARYPDLHVLLCGEGPLREALRETIERTGLDGRVHLLGNRDDVADLLAAADLFVLPSLWEGLPVALLEAMASRLPVVATDVSGSRQVVVPGETGLLVPPGDPDRLGAAIVELLEAPERARAFGEAARRRVEDHFSARAMAVRHAELYRALAAGGGA
ncbi:MAG TPA: glycosyltransferase, partial [Candidatus Limnocylindrales bacterium]|nr:glycosyltransferase [Candidatus Limnocylindrales bacterium]